MADTQTKIKSMLGIKQETGGTLAKTTSSELSTQESIKNVVDSINTFPATLSNIYTEYKSLFVLLLILFSTFVVLRFTAAILGAVDGIPLMAPVAELLGLGYGAWFIYRYLIWSDTRQELLDDIESIKSKFTGKK